MLATCLNSAEEPPDPKQDTNGNTLPGQITQMTAISAMNPPRSLTARGATTLLAGGSQHHYQPALPHSLQFMQDNLCGVWNQCPMSHRVYGETARANFIVSSVGSPGKYHQMCGRAITLQRVAAYECTGWRNRLQPAQRRIRIFAPAHAQFKAHNFRDTTLVLLRKD